MVVNGGGEKLYFFDSNYRKVYEISIKNDNIFKIEGMKKNNNTMEFVVCSNNNENIYLLTIPNNNIFNFNDYKIRKIRENIKTRICFQFNKDFILCNEDGLFQINDLTSNITRSEAIHIPNIDKSYWTGIKINSELIALTSNKSIVNGEDRIIFYNYYGKRIVKYTENHSFSLSQNNLALMPIEGAVKNVKITEIDKSNKILLCACKKYLEDQKNGILLLKLELNNNFKILSQNFYETLNFEVSCICPISEFDEKNILNKEGNKLIETDKFLVGGFNSDTNQGLIKLYKVNYNKDNFEKTDIECLGDFKTGKEKDINMGYITCIIQSKYNGSIALTFSNGNFYHLEYQTVINLNNLNKKK